MVNNIEENYPNVSYRQIKESMNKAIKHYGDELEVIYLFCNKTLTTTTIDNECIFWSKMCMISLIYLHFLNNLFIIRNIVNSHYYNILKWSHVPMKQ